MLVIPFERLLCLLLVQPCLAQIPQSPIAVTLRTESGTYKTLGEAMLEVSFTNQSNSEITTETVTDPPISKFTSIDSNPVTITVVP